MAVCGRQERLTLEERALELGKRLLEELAQARRTMGWTVLQLAQVIGLERKAVLRLERGVGSMETLIAAMAALKFQFAGVANGDTLGQQLANRRTTQKLSVEMVATKTKLAGSIIDGLENETGSTTDLFLVLALVAPAIRRHAPERVHWSLAEKAARDSRFTSPDFMEEIYDAFGPVDLDPCGHPMSPVVASRRIILSEGGDGLADDWSGRLAYVNPPYSAQLKWLERAYQQWSDGKVETVICLAPVRPDNKFFHETLRHVADFYLIKGRLRFASPSGDVKHTPFSLWIVALGTTVEQRKRLAELVPGCWFHASEPAA